MKICYILPEYNENTDSHFFHLYEFLEELSKRMDIFLIVEKFTPSNELRSKIRDVKMGTRVYIQKFKFIPFRFLESFVAILRARILGYKIFYTHYAYIGAINAAIVSRLSGGKSYYWNCAMNWLFKQRKYFGIGYKLCLKLSHFLVTGSEEMKKGYASHYNLNPRRIKVMPNWINLERFKSQKSQSKAGPPRVEKLKTLLFVHWLSKRKGMDMIVPIVKQLENFKTQIPKFKLLVIGGGPHKEQLLKEIKENNLDNLIKVLGAVPNKKIVDYYAKADIFIMPSMEEGFPRVLLEAMASGVPYVASDVGAVREISPEIAQRFLVKPGDIEMFAHKIEALISDKKTYDEFKEEELEKVKQYSLDGAINKFVKLFG